jgi:hypothetical protein
VKEIGDPSVIKASNGDTVLDKKMSNPRIWFVKEQLLAQHSESINCTSVISNYDFIVTETNRSSNRTRKIPATRSNDFYGKFKC